MDLRDGGHRARPRRLEGGADDQGLAILEEKEGRQPCAAVEGDSRQIEEVGRGRRVQGVRAGGLEPLGDSREPPPINLLVYRHGRDAISFALRASADVADGPAASEGIQYFGFLSRILNETAPLGVPVPKKQFPNCLN